MSDHPEHDKLMLVSGESQAIGAFLDWLMNEQGAIIANWHRHTEGCVCRDPWHEKTSWNSDERCSECGSLAPRRRYHCCGYAESYPNPIHRSIEDWLALYFAIDTAALEREKRALLEKLRSAA